MDDEELIKEFIRVAPPGSILANDDLLKVLVFVELDLKGADIARRVGNHWRTKCWTVGQCRGCPRGPQRAY